MNKEFWITNALLVTQNSNRTLRRGHLRIVDGRIASISSSLPRGKSSREALDVAGHVVLPGFVQAHVHLCQTLFRNQADDMELLDWLSKRIWQMEAAHTEETLHVSALLGIHELLSTGTTCVLDMGTVRHTEAILQAVRDSGIRANVGKCLMDHPKTTPPSLREPTSFALSEANSLYKKWHGTSGDRVRISYAPRFVLSCTRELLSSVARLSREQKAVVHTHASENLKEVRLVNQLTGHENVEFLHRLGLTSPRLVLAHCIWLKPNEKQILHKTRTHVVHCPSSNLKLASGIAPIPELRNRGINVALGADGAPCNNNLNMFTEMRLAALIHKPGTGPRAMRAQEVLDMATRDGARALGWQEEIGSIEIGKKADLICLDLRGPENSVPYLLTSRRLPTIEAVASSIVYSTSALRLKWTMVDGRLLYRNGRVRTIALPSLMNRVGTAQDRIRKALGMG